MAVEGLRLAVEAVQQTQKVEQVVLQEVELVEAFLEGFQRHRRRRCFPSEALAKYQAKVTLKNCCSHAQKSNVGAKMEISRDFKPPRARRCCACLRVAEIVYWTDVFPNPEYSSSSSSDRFSREDIAPQCCLTRRTEAP